MVTPLPCDTVPVRCFLLKTDGSCAGPVMCSYNLPDIRRLLNAQCAELSELTCDGHSMVLASCLPRGGLPSLIRDGEAAVCGDVAVFGREGDEVRGLLSSELRCLMDRRRYMLADEDTDGPADLICVDMTEDEI